MPFGLDLKSIVIGVALALWVFPMVMGFLGSRRSSQNTAA